MIPHDDSSRLREARKCDSKRLETVPWKTEGDYIEKTKCLPVV